MITSHLKDDIRYITIDRTSKANAITANMLDEMIEIAGVSNENKALIITGSGKVFSAGADLDEVNYCGNKRYGCRRSYGNGIGL